MLDTFDTCAPALLGWCGFSGLLTITPVEPIHAAGGIDQLLLACKERMASRTNLNVQIAFTGRSGFESLSTGAGHGYLFIFRVNSRLHFISHHYSSRLVISIKQPMIRVATVLRQAGGSMKMSLVIL